MDIDPIKAAEYVWRYRHVFALRLVSKEERTAYAILRTECRDLWERYQALPRDSAVIKFPTTTQGRPLISMPRDESEAEALTLQKSLWSHLAKLRETLDRYGWDTIIANKFELLRSWEQQRDPSEAGWLFAQFGKEEQLLAWLETRPFYTDIGRKLRVLDSRRHSPAV
jgi:hypothetical protein